MGLEKFFDNVNHDILHGFKGISSQYNNLDCLNESPYTERYLRWCEMLPSLTMRPCLVINTLIKKVLIKIRFIVYIC